MAILNNLIVNGAARFLNKTYFDTISADKVDANEGIFKKLIAKDATLDNATVVGLLDVTGELHTRSFTNSNIATIDGSFYITPTLGLQGANTTTNTVTVTANSLSFANASGTSFSFESLYLENTTSPVAWSTGSSVIVTGEIQDKTTGEWIPLGTLKGTLSTYTTTSVVINTIKDSSNGTAPATLAAIVSSGTTSGLKYRNIKVSLISVNRSGLKPLGIFMTATGSNGRTFLDIYGGNNAEVNTYGGLSTPVLRIGNLNGLPAIQGVNPTGWGIYTTNGFFSGLVAADRGKIGGWNIGTDTNKSLYTNTFNSSGGIYISPSYSGTLTVGGNTSKNWAFTAGNAFGVTTAGVLYASGAQIQGDLKARTLSTGTKTNSTSGNGFYVDNYGNIYVGNESTNNFTVTNAGVLTATGATLTNLTIKNSATGTPTIGTFNTNGITLYDQAGTQRIKITSSGGVVIGKASGKGRIEVTDSGMNIYNASGTQTSSFGDSITLGSNAATVTIGKVAANNYNTVISNQGITINDNATPIAQFSSLGAQIGKSGIGYIDIKSTGIDFYSGSNNNNLAHIGYELTNIDSRGNIDMAPCITFGSRDYRNVSFDEFDDAIFEEPTDYDSTVAYHAGTIVKYNNIFYISTYNSTGITPSSSATYWRRIIGANSFVQGRDCIASGIHSHAKGYATRAVGDVSTAEGDSSVALGAQSHAEGRRALASGQLSHAEGARTIASGTYSHAEGSETEASGNFTHAEGYKTISSSIEASHAEGWASIASGRRGSHAEGSNTIASGDSSHAQNFYTVATGDSQTVIGRYNAATVTGSGANATYTNVGSDLFIIGNGTANTTAGRKNILSVDTSGNIRIRGKIYINGTTNNLSDATELGGGSYLPISGGTITNNLTVNGTITAGARVTSTAPTSEASVDRIIITPYYHTDGPWYIKSTDDGSNAYLDLYYGTSKLMRVIHDGTFYINGTSNRVAGMSYTNGYWGLALPNGQTNTNAWIRTTQAGLIPYQGGGRGSGHCYVGTDSWYFQHGYIDNVHGVTLDFSGTATIGGVTRINNALYSDILYTGSGVVNGNLSVGGTLYQSSDRRLKKHIDYLGKDAITFIQNLKPAHYIKDEKEYVGFYAQDVDKIDYWGTMTEINEDNYYSLNYSEIIAPLVTYCHYLEERIKKLEER